MSNDKSVTFNADEALHAVLVRLAGENERSLSAQIRYLLRKGLEAEGEKTE